MDILITESIKAEHGTYVTATCGKTSAFVCIHRGGLDGIRVCCKNASHRVFRGAGKFFANLEDAINGYRSPEMKAIIQAAASQSLHIA
jgi:hypothetical protein